MFGRLPVLLRVTHVQSLTLTKTACEKWAARHTAKPRQPYG